MPRQHGSGPGGHGLLVVGLQLSACTQQSAEADWAPRVVRHSAVLYDANGDTRVYANSEPVAYVREPVTVEDIQRGQAVPTDGPPEGTPVVTVGAAELSGTEFGVGR